MDSTHDSDRIVDGARHSLVVQRGGGRHRAGGRGGSIGEGAARLKRQAALARLKRILIAIGVIVVAAMGFGLFVGALGFEGLFVTLLLLAIAVGFLLKFPAAERPRRETLARGDMAQSVARTELWLEMQRPALPAPARQIVDGIGVQLDALAGQLRDLDQNTPEVVAARSLVTRDLPEVIDSYTRIPRHLRAEASAGSTPDAQLADSLRAISREIDGVARQLAEGDLDALAVRNRYLETKYGGPATAPAPALSDQSKDI